MNLCNKCTRRLALVIGKRTVIEPIDLFNARKSGMTIRQLAVKFGITQRHVLRLIKKVRGA